MERDFAIISDYMNNNKIQINVVKTKIMRFSIKSRPILDFSVNLGGNQVNEVENLKCLGLTFQTNLNWSTHIDQILSKISRSLGILYKFRRKFNQETKLQIYNGLFLPHLQYLPSIWGHGPETALMKLQRKQNQALKLVYGLNARYPTVSLYRDVVPTFLKVKSLSKYQTLLFMFKHKNGIGHQTVDSIQLNTNSINTRYRNEFSDVPSRTSFGAQKISTTGCRLWNDLSRLANDIRQTTSISLFKRDLKRYLTSEQ